MAFNYEQLRVLAREATANPERVLPYFNRLVQDKKAGNAIKKIRKTSIVWHVCTYKAASTLLMNYLAATLRRKNSKAHFFSCVPFAANRPQVFCQCHISKRIESKRVNVSTHHHTLATNDLYQMISDNHVVMCQTRGILDTIVSLIDYFDMSPVSSASRMAYHYWDQLSRDQKIDNLIERYVPWHIDFLQGWLVASKTYDVHWIDYNEAINDPRDYFEKVFSRFNISSFDSVSLASDKMNLNKGVVGRGKTDIPVSQQDRIAEKIEKADHLNQNLIRFL